jgi:translocation and assembly module TamA
MVQMPISPTIQALMDYFLRLVILVGLSISAVMAQKGIDVEISGLSSTLENNVRFYLSIEQQKNQPLISDGRLHRLHQKAEQEIAAALQPYGYYRPVINASLNQNDSSRWSANYQIDPGPQLTMSEYHFYMSPEMAEDLDFKQLIKEHTRQPGSVFTHLWYENFKSGLVKLAAEKGYRDAQFTEHRIEIDLDAYVARIFLRYEGGERYHFGEIHLQQDVLDEELLVRYLPFESGDPFLLDKLIEVRQVLNDTQYFKTVAVSTQEPSVGSVHLPVVLNLTPHGKHRFETGVGYGTDTGARARFGWIVPLINRRGHHFNSDLEVSELGYNVSANYRVPVLNPRTDQFVLSVGEEFEDFEDTETTLQTLGISLVHSRNQWRETLAINYQEEDFASGDDQGKSRLLIPGISWSRTWGNDFINVFDGLRLDLNVRGADDNISSDTSFSQVRGYLKVITPINRRNRVITRGEFGITETSKFEKLPSSVRFFAGGAQSVRGYRYQSLGPKDDDNDVLGGRNLLAGSIEFEHYLNDRWGLAVFLDAGNAIDQFNEDLERGAGFGVRWKSPIGVLRVDFASAISLESSPWRLHINIGPDL